MEPHTQHFHLLPEEVVSIILLNSGFSSRGKKNEDSCHHCYEHPNSEPNRAAGISGGSISKLAETMNTKWVFVCCKINCGIFPCRVHGIMQMSNHFLSHIRDSERRGYDCSSAETFRNVRADANRKSVCECVHRQPPSAFRHYYSGGGGETAASIYRSDI